MSPSAERALLPTSRGNNDERALVPTALLISPDIRRLAAQRSFAQPHAAFTLRQRDAKRRAKRGAEAPGQRTAACRLLRRVRPPVIRRQFFAGVLVPTKTVVVTRLS